MERKTIEEKVISIIKEFVQEEPIEINLASSLRGETGINSMALISIILRLEDSFGICIEDENIPQMITIDDAVSYVENSLN